MEICCALSTNGAGRWGDTGYAGSALKRGRPQGQEGVSEFDANVMVARNIYK